MLTGSNGGVAADLDSGASLDLTVNTETLARSADNAWAAVKAENGSIRINGADPSINVNIYGLGTAGDWAILPEFTINAFYAENGLATANGETWTADMVNLTYAASPTSSMTSARYSPTTASCSRSTSPNWETAR